MNTYQSIVVAVDLTQSAEDVIERAKSIATSHQATMNLLHVIDYVPYMGFGEGALISPTYAVSREELLTHTRKPLNDLAKKMQLENTEIVTEFGNAGTEIVRYANSCHADLIILGSHGRHGVKLLLGSTANSVLHHALCDVLAVRIKD